MKNYWKKIMYLIFGMVVVFGTDFTLPRWLRDVPTEHVEIGKSGQREKQMNSWIWGRVRRRSMSRRCMDLCTRFLKSVLWTDHEGESIRSGRGVV